MFDIVNLKCEYRYAPLGICERNPRFSWMMTSDERGSTQSAYRLRVAISKERLDGGTYIYDSGRVESEQCFGVRYGGEPLETVTKYFWSVTVWDATGRSASAESSFETGLFSLDDWPTKWITAEGADGPIHIRSSFFVPENKTVRSARLYSATTTGAFGNLTFCVNDVYPTLNGEKLGKDVLLPGQISEKGRRAVYRTYDITDGLLSGENAFGAVVLSMAYGAFADITFTDGTKERVLLTDNCKVNGKGPYTLWDEGVEDQGGKREDYDSLREYVGYDMQKYDDSGWIAPRFTDKVSVLHEQTVTTEVIESLKPVTIKQIGGTHYVLDFGKVVNGHIQLVIRGAVGGRRISVAYAEALLPNGELDSQSTINYQRGENGPHIDTYVPRGEETEIYEPRFANHSFRYVCVMNFPGQPWSGRIPDALYEATAHVVHSPVLTESDFCCSDEDINSLYAISHLSQRDNLASVPTDCPSRERHGWLGDAMVVSESECINFDMLTFYESWMRSIGDDQYSYGNLQYITPFQSDIIKDNVDIPWCTAAVVIPWVSYSAYGDSTVLRQSFGIIRRWIDFLHTLADENGYVARGAMWGDHTAVEPMDRGWLGTIYYYVSLSYAAKIAAALGEDDVTYAECAARVKALLCKKLTESRGFDGGRQGDLAHAISLGLADGDEEKRLLDMLIEDIEKHGYRMTCGCLGIYHLIPALEKHGRHDIIYRICKAEGRGTFLDWINTYGATTAFEYLNISDWESRNHPFLMGSVTRWFYEGLAGIRKTAEGYKTFEVDPHVPDGMEYTEAKVSTLYGVIRARTERRTSGWRYEITVPCGTRARLILPDGEHVILDSGNHILEI